jgi:four helix bundle protein
MPTRDGEESFAQWTQGVSPHVLRDPLWRHTAYQLAAYLAYLAWLDSLALEQRAITRAVAAQLLRAAASVSANIAEGYSRGSGKDRVRVYEYALGSARECTAWYNSARYALGEQLADERIELCQRICRLLLATIPAERERTIRRRRTESSG